MFFSDARCSKTLRSIFLSPLLCHFPSQDNHLFVSKAIYTADAACVEGHCETLTG